MQAFTMITIKHIRLWALHAHASHIAGNLLALFLGSEATRFLCNRGWLKMRSRALDGRDEGYGGARAYFQFLLRVVNKDGVRANGAPGHTRADFCRHYVSGLDKSCTYLAFAIA